MAHAHPIKVEAVDEGFPSDRAATGSIFQRTPTHITNLTRKQLVAANASPLLVNTGWLLLQNTAKPSQRMVMDKVELATARTLVLLRYVAEGPTSRLFHVKDGPEERLLKLYHTFPDNPVEYEAHKILKEYAHEEAQEEDSKLLKLAPTSYEESMVVYEVDGKQVQQYGITLEYVRAESLSDAARKIHHESIDDIETSLKATMRALHKAGIAHGNLAASNVMLDDPVRYQACLELKPMSRQNVTPLLVGFSSAKFEKDLSEEEWKKAKTADQRKFRQMFTLLRAQSDTNNALRYLKRQTADQRQEDIRQRALVRSLAKADPYDNELSYGLIDFHDPGLALVLAIATHLEKAEKHLASLIWLEKFKDDHNRGTKSEFVDMHVKIAEAMSKVNRSQELVENAWDQAIEFSKESLGMANPTTMNVRRSKSFWYMENGEPDRAARDFSQILLDIMTYHQRGTGMEMVKEEFLDGMKNWASSMELRLAKEDGPQAIRQTALKQKLAQQCKDFMRWAQEADQKREKEDASKKEKNIAAKPSAAVDRRTSMGSVGATPRSTGKRARAIVEQGEPSKKRKTTPTAKSPSATTPAPKKPKTSALKTSTTQAPASKASAATNPVQTTPPPNT